MVVLFVVAIVVTLPLGLAMHHRFDTRSPGWAGALVSSLYGGWFCLASFYILDASGFDACGNGGPCSSAQSISVFVRDVPGLLLFVTAADLASVATLLRGARNPHP